MSKFNEYLNKIKDQGYNEMKVDMAHLGVMNVILDYEYKGVFVRGETPSEIILKLNDKLDKPMDAKTETAIREDIANKANMWLRDIMDQKRITGMDFKQKNQAIPLY